MNLMHPLENYLERGLIAGPDESEEVFNNRICPSKEMAGWMKGALDRVHSCFGMCPDWVEVVFDSKGVRPWEGGYFLFCDKPLLVLHPSLAYKRRLFGLYDRDEILAHELVHAIRARFDKSCFEEHLAHLVSSSRARRFFGPLFSAPFESTLFVALTVFTALATFFNDYLFAIFPPMVLLAYAAFLFARLIWQQRLLRRCINQLVSRLGNRGFKALLFLKDEEIKRIAKGEIKEFEREISVSNECRLRALYFVFCPSWEKPT